MNPDATPMHPPSWSTNLWEKEVQRPNLNIATPRTQPVNPSKMPPSSFDGLNDTISDTIMSTFFQGFIAGLAVGVVLMLSVKA